MAAEPTTKPAAAAGTVTLGDLTVNRMGFGAMRLTGSGVWGDPPDREGAKAVIRRAVELGVTLIDTAASYGPEVNEELIAETLHPYPEGLVVATKGGLTRPGPGRWQPDGRPETLRESLEGSLRRLRLERIDLYQLHSVDSQVPLEESVGALAELQRQGKIRHVGLSNVDARQLATAQGIVEVVSVQNRYNVGDRYSDRVLDACEQRGSRSCPVPARVGGARLGNGPTGGDRAEPRRDAGTGRACLAAAALPGDGAHPGNLVGGASRGGPGGGRASAHRR